MLLNKKSVELLAPVGQWETLEAAVKAGADAVYMGGKAFNMRMFRDDFNFDNASLKKAVEYTHSHGVNLYITLNNLISDDEIPQLVEYLKCLDRDIKPDALIIQDLAVIEIVKKLGLKLNLHSSIMMNTHNELMIEKFKQYGISRIVASREMSLSEICILKQKTGIELEYFVHGDMCIAEGGQCLHSGIVFGNSSNRGRCMKACRWQYKFGEETKIADPRFLSEQKFSYKMALKDMCMYRALPELIQSGVYSFKIEGRMRDAAFVSQLVGIYRRAIDRYIADPAGYSVDNNDWQKLSESKVRGFSTCFAVSKPTYKDIGLTGEDEPRFFSKAVKEAGFEREKTVLFKPKEHKKPDLSVHCASLLHLKEACANGADAVYAGGDVYRPLKPWTIAEFAEARKITAEKGCRLIITTPRITRTREISELEQLFSTLGSFKPDGILVHNMGTFSLAKKLTNLPVYCGSSFSLFNCEAAALLKSEGAVQAAVSLELAHKQTIGLIGKSTLPIEVVVHGSIEAMICDFDFIMEETGKNQLDDPEAFEKHYAFIDMADEVHAVRRTQYNRNHVLFSHDICLMPYLESLAGAASFCIEAQDYSPEYTGRLVNIYRQMIDDYTAYDVHEIIEEIEQTGPRSIGNGVYRYDTSK
ncbi:peptidase U32 family protein [Pectinatus haikarae]|uniref:Protease n=1 Tax=Pectinatus haikarae TaxID=349096 RepID=A0ABT9YBE5_9FIRM|nr:U32 family peptidase [Pectinatus haikarae]MDQ0205031.1 putative protease [Pectinatus haikarae]